MQKLANLNQDLKNKFKKKKKNVEKDSKWRRKKQAYSLRFYWMFLFFHIWFLFILMDVCIFQKYYLYSLQPYYGWSCIDHHHKLKHTRDIDWRNNEVKERKYHRNGNMKIKINKTVRNTMTNRPIIELIIFKRPKNIL